MFLSKGINTFISLVLLSSCLQTVLKHSIMLPSVFERFSLIIASIHLFKECSLSPLSWWSVGNVDEKHNKINKLYFILKDNTGHSKNSKARQGDAESGMIFEALGLLYVFSVSLFYFIYLLRSFYNISR